MPLPTRVMRNQVDPFEAMHREFDQMLGRAFAREGNGGGLSYSPYPVDVRETQDHLVVEAELPGFRKEDIELTLENQTLTVSAERKEEQKQHEGDWLLRERRYGRFMRTFTLPPTVDDKKVDAKLNDGVLTITLNKREETKPRKIQVG